MAIKNYITNLNTTPSVVYGFLTDSALSSINLVPNNIDTEPMGVMTKEVNSYLVDQYQLRDQRSNRLGEAGIVVDNSLSGTRMAGEMAFYFDGEASITYNGLLLNALNNATVTTKATFTNSFFNVVEYVMQRGNSANNPISAIENDLISDQNTFASYVAGSLSRSAAPAATITNTILQRNALASGSRTFSKWIQFSLSLGANTFTFRVYLLAGSLSTLLPDTFLGDYPHSIITSVITQISANQIVDKNALLSTVISQIGTATNELEQTLATATDSITGYFKSAELYNTNAIYSGDTTNRTAVSLPYIVAYHGKSPSLAEAKAALRNYLLTNSSATAAELQLLFNGLFATQKMYIVPLFDNVTIGTSTGTAQLSGILDYQTCLSKAFDAFCDFEGYTLAERAEGTAKQIWVDRFVRTNLEIVSVPNSKVYCLAIPSAENEDSDSNSQTVYMRSFFTYNPSYNARSQDSVYWDDQDASAQMVSLGLSENIQKLENNTFTNSELSTLPTAVNGVEAAVSRKALAFTVDTVTYYVDATLAIANAN